MSDRRVGVVKRGDPQGSAVEHKPGPAAGEMVDRFLVKLLKHGFAVAETVLDQLRKLTVRLLALGRREALPEEAVVPQLCAVVEQLVVAGPLGLADDLDERCAAEAVVALDQLVRLVDVGAVMLA